MAVYTTVTGVIGSGDGLEGTIIAEIRNLIQLSDGAIVPAGTRLEESVTGGTYAIDVPPTDTATPSGEKVYFFFRPADSLTETYIGRKTIPTSASSVTFQSLS